MNASTLAGADNEPGWLQGYGDLAAALARDLAMTPASLQALFVNPQTGQLMDLSPELRTPGARLDRFIRWRDGICTAPACGADAEYLDLDHLTPVSNGGKTIRLNLHPVCPRHHRSRHTGSWTISRSADGSETWTDPHGNSYQTIPTTYSPTADATPLEAGRWRPPDVPDYHPPGDHDPLESTTPLPPHEADDPPGDPPGDEPCPF